MFGKAIFMDIIFKYPKGKITLRNMVLLLTNCSGSISSTFWNFDSDIYYLLVLSERLNKLYKKLGIIYAIPRKPNKNKHCYELARKTLVSTIQIEYSFFSFRKHKL
jgi:hypothetical protein